MTEILIKALQLILSLSLLVFVHELGHFGFARLFRVRVDKFYLFFNWRFSIFRAKKIDGKWQFKWFAKNPPDRTKPLLDEEGIAKTDKKGNAILVPVPVDELDDSDWRKHPTTEWGIGWIPLGGYCKIAGMVDESLDAAVINSKPQPWEYRSRPVWQRILMITGGVLMNFFAAVVIFAMMLFSWGKEYLPVNEAYMGYNFCQTALDNGFVNGDKIIAIDGKPVFLKQEALEQLIIDGKRQVRVERAGDTVDFLLPELFGEMMLKAKDTKIFMAERMPFVIDLVMENTPAAAAHLQSGDSVVGLNGKPLSDYDNIIKELERNKNNRITIDIFRHGALLSDSITVNENGKIGVQRRHPMYYFKTSREEFGFLSSFPAGWQLGIETLSSYVKQFKLVFSKAGMDSLGGFGTIGSLFSGQWNWQNFWSMTAFLSIILAFMNILPIPVLDGGYLLFLLYELITRRKPSDRFMEIALRTGLYLMLALLIFANANDLLRVFGLK
ncbi:MAG: RIP metalloprotease RseP [Prevotellaceae bacterium]|jgi:regulator of sigma E protease|nr:RIP metalloprotease RseP [Prevotellaceae bacterium]